MPDGVCWLKVVVAFGVLAVVYRVHGMHFERVNRGRRFVHFPIAFAVFVNFLWK